MAEESAAPARTRKERLAAVCENLEEIRADLRSDPDGDEAPLDTLLAALRAGQDPAKELAELHTALQAGGDPLGLDGYTGTRATRGPRLAGIGHTPAGETVYLCPQQRCARYWLPPSGAAAVPRCALSGTHLRRDRL